MIMASVMQELRCHRCKRLLARSSEFKHSMPGFVEIVCWHRSCRVWNRFEVGALDNHKPQGVD